MNEFNKIVPSISLNPTVIDSTALSLISEELAWKHHCIPIGLNNGRLQVAMSDPMDSNALDDLRLYSGYQIEPLLADAEEIRIAIRECLTVSKTRLDKIEEHDYLVNAWKVDDYSDYALEAPVISLVDSIFRQAILEKASDIHWEPKEENYIVRFRIDGGLEIKTILPVGIARSIAARLKVMAGLDVTERRIPQDGRIKLDHADKVIDIRVSTFATVCGEKVVTRILDDQTAGLSLAQLGMRQEVEEGVRSLLHQPHGLILISGPTGSGKTTTLYALLRELASDSLNIVSIEDPVEYRLQGVNQAQVNTKIGFDFAGGLRSILRQDPDIIMVGEIRDKETARMATAAALTGHLVLSTVHTNTAAEGFARMLDMEIEAYQIAASLCGIIAQRLVRRLCLHCRDPYHVPQEVQAAFGWQDRLMIYRPMGCSKCRGTGYHGRIGIHEFLPYNPIIKELVIQKSSSAQLEKAARKLGMLTLWEDGLSKVRQGYTSLEEVMRLLAGV